MQTIDTSIQPQKMKRALLHATLWGAFGAFLLVSGAFLDLSYGGWMLAILAFGLIAWAFRPFQRLKKLEVNPERLVLTETEIVWVRKKERVHIPRDKIRSICYKENKQFYGIVILFTSNREMEIPYFSERSYKMIEKSINL